MAVDDDVRKIEVGVSWLSGQDTAAAMQFTEALKASTAFFSSFNAKDITDSFTKALAAIDAQQKSQVHAQSMQNISRGGTWAQPPSTSSSTSNIPIQSYNDQLAGYAQQQQQTIDQAATLAAVTAPTITQQSAQQIQQNMAGDGIAGKFKAGVVDQIQRLSRLSHVGPFGPFASGGQGVTNAQGQPITSESDWGDILKAGVKTGISTTLEAGVVGTMLNTGRNMIGGTIRGITDPITTAVSMLADPYSAQMMGAQLGYQRGGGFLGLPFASPFSSATTEGYRQQLDALKLAFQPGINLGQAQAIEQASAGYGFSGAMGGNVTDNLLAPLFQKYGMNPQQVLQNFGAGLRTGIQTVQSLRTNLEGLAQSARTASLTITDASNAMAATVQSVQSIGGTPQGGQQFANSFMNTFGLPSNVGGQLLTSPLVQSVIAMQTGVMPSLQGALLNASPTTGITGISSTIQLLNQMYGKAFPSFTQQVKLPNGQVVGTQTESSRTMGAAMISSYLQSQGVNMDVGQVERFLSWTAPKGPEAWENPIEFQANQYGNLGSTSALKSSALTHFINQTIGKGAILKSTQGTGASSALRQLPAGAQVTSYNANDNTFSVRLANGQTQTMQVDVAGAGRLTPDTSISGDIEKLAATGNSHLWNQITNNLKRSDLWSTKTMPGTHITYAQNEINKLNRLSSPQARASALTNDIANQNRKIFQGNNSIGGQTLKIAIGFQGSAAKALTANPNTINLNLNANSGTGPTMNYAIAQPQGINSLYGPMPYDEGNFNSYNG